MQVRIDGKKQRLNKNDVIGEGGEATVFAHKNAAVKVFHQPTRQRDAKLRALLPRTLPSSVVTPQGLVTDENGLTIGYTMRLLPPNHDDLRRLSIKKYRAQSGLTATDVIQLFIDMQGTLSALHTDGVVVGDLNDLNLYFTPGSDEVQFIDADSFQFDTFPCMVGTEQFIDPLLYGCDLASAPQFTPSNDWYAFAVLLFKSLLLTHPYGGIHPTVNTLTERAKSKISVLDAQVKYPRIAYSPDLLSDDLLDAFEQWFSVGYRGIFSADLLMTYAASLRMCLACRATYPQTRGHCPVCSAAVPVNIDLPAGETLLRTPGHFVAWHVGHSEVHLLAHEGGKVVLHTLRNKHPHRRVELFNTVATAHYAFLGDSLIASTKPGELLVVDVAQPTPVPITKTTTGTFNGDSVFGSSHRSLYRLAGGYLLRGDVRDGHLVERSIMAIAEGQTWFTVDPVSEQVFGYFRVFETQVYWLLRDENRYDVDLPKLQPGETLLDMGVRFTDSTALVTRHTRHNGTEHVHLTEIDNRGRVLHSQMHPALDYGPIGAPAYARGVLVRATDQGVIQTRLDNGLTRTFQQTEPLVKTGDVLYPYQKGLLTIADQSVAYVQP